MTNAEAIAILSNDFEVRGLHNTALEAIDMAISALEKQEWKKPTGIKIEGQDPVITRSSDAGATTFRSNCLWEAIKAKLKCGKSVRIVHMRSHDGLHHWGWVDKRSGDLYDFTQTEIVKHWIQYLKFEGYIRKQSGGLNSERVH